jgi:PAS domain S-box-containing protein
MRLSHRLLMVIVLALVPISGFVAVITLRLEASQVRSAYSEAERILRLVEDEQSNMIFGIRQILVTLRHTRAVREGDPTACQRLLDELKPDYPDHIDIHVTDSAGVIRCATDASSIGLDVAHHPHVQAALAGEEFTVGRQIVVQGRSSGALPFSTPVAATASKPGAAAGAVTALLDMAWLESVLAQKVLPAGAALSIADRDGRILARVPSIPDLAGQRLPDRFLALLEERGPGTRRMAGLDGIDRVIAFSPLRGGADGLFLAVGIDDALALAPIRRARASTLAALAVIAAATATTVLWLSRRYLQHPVAALAEAARRWRSGDLAARARIPSSALEFATLADDFNAMADALDARKLALEASEGRHRAVFETAVDAMVVIDEAGIVHAANPATARIFGYAPEEMTGRNVSMLMGEDNRAAHDGYIGNYLRTGLRRIIGIGREVWGRRKDGSSFPLELSIAEWRDPRGRRFFTGIMRDVSGRRRSEEALSAERERLRRIVEGAPFPAIVHADDGHVLHVSRAWLDATGFTRGELATMDDWAQRAYGRRKPEVKAEIDRLYELDRPVDEGEYEIRTADGRIRVWAFRSAPVGADDQGRRLIVSMAADLTERREGEERLRLLMREVDHRAKNALAVVQAIVQLSRTDDPESFSESVQGRIQAMARAHTLLAASRWSGADLQRLVSEEVDAYESADRIELEGGSVSLRPEATQAVSLALHELATNAAKHGALAGEHGRLRVSWATQGDTLRIDWEERDGPPIAAPPRHSGFGTMLLQQVVEGQLRGTVRWDWRAEGLACRLALPADTWQVSGVSDMPPTPQHGPRQAAAAGHRVLVVEDEALTALALKDLLEGAGFHVLGPAARVEEALDLLRSGRPDAAVLDVNLFGATVQPVAETLEGMGVPFLFCTGYQAAENAGRRHPQAPVLSKPVNANHLLAAVNRLVADGGRPGSGAAPPQDAAH